MDESEIQEPSESPREIDAARGSGHFWLIFNVTCVLLILWLTRDWLLRAQHWFDSQFQKEIARRLGISSGAIGFLYFLVHTIWQFFHATTTKKQKSAEEEKKQFNPRYNPIEEWNSESWSHERDHD
jgi:type VI protein secretion system component VasK